MSIVRNLSVTNHLWRYEPPPVEKIRSLQLKHKLPLLAAKAYATTDIQMPLTDWFAPSLAHLHDPYEMLGMERAVERILRLVRDQEKVLLVTDYDADGTTSCIVLKSTLITLMKHDREKIFTKIPTRKEGYGFNAPAVEMAKEVGATVIITADIGVRDHHAVSLAKAAGIDVIICDHHLPPGESVPQEAYAVLCPPQDGCTYPNPSLAACGVCFKLAQALLGHSIVAREKHDQVLRGLMKVVCIGTVGDVVSLATQENRAIVSLGIEALIADRVKNKPGMKALLNVAGVTDSLTAQDVGFKLAPRINAAGRMADPALIERLFFEPHPDEAQKLAKELDTLNTRRKEIQQEMVDSIAEMVPEEIPNFIVITGTKEDGFHKGVSGIVAARLRDQFNRPVAVASGNGEHFTGSIRSIGEVHAVEALDQCADILQKYGGHPVAAGFSLKAEHLEEFQQRLNDYVAATTDPEQLVPVRLCQVKCTLDELNFQSIQAFMKMEPFGKDNYKPLVWLSNVNVRRVETMGKENNHVRCLVGDMKALWWRAAEHVPFLKSGPVDLLIEPGFNRFNGRTTVQLTIVDARPTSEG